MNLFKKKSLKNKVAEAVIPLSAAVQKLCEENGHPNTFDEYDPRREDIVPAILRMQHTITAQIPHIVETSIDLVSAEEEIKDLQNELSHMKAASSELKDLSISTKNELEYQIKEANVRANAATKQYEALVDSLMTFRDQMMFFMDNTQNEDIIKLLQNLYKESGRIATGNGVELLNSNGPFSTDSQIVKSTVSTEDKALIETVCVTLRDGYKINGKIIRPQEIVLYVENTEN